MGIQLFTNNAQSQLSGTLPQGGTTLVCSAGQGSRFPTPGVGEFFYLTLYTKDAYASEQEVEILKVTERAGDVMTVERDIELITGQTGGFAYDGSSSTVYIDMRWTAGCVDNLVQKSSLGTAAVLDVAATGDAGSTEVVKGDDSRLTDARTPTTHTHSYEPADAGIQSHLGSTTNPHSVTKTQVGLGNVDNTSDASKPVSTAQATADAVVLAAAATDATTKANARQAVLVSGTSIKTINSTSLLGSGNLVTGDVTLTGTQTLTNKTVESGVFTNGYTEESVAANTSTAYTVDLANGTLVILTLTGDVTYTFPTPVAGKSFTLVQKQDATGSRTVTWPASVKWPSGTAPTITSTASKADKFVFTAIDGTSWLGSVAGQNYTV